MSKQAMEKVEEDIWARATKAADDLYQIKETFFPENPDEKVTKLQNESDLALNLLDSIPPEQRKSPVQRATYEYLKGKILDVVPEYRKDAEDHLSKAVKLNPSLADAWLCLGSCIWKKGDLSAAKNCFNLALSKGPNKKILCQLSMLERSMAQGTENQAEIVEESIQHAKEAITLDVKDGNSWCAHGEKHLGFICCTYLRRYMLHMIAAGEKHIDLSIRPVLLVLLFLYADNLGNACLTSFFVTGAWDHSKLLQSLKAYQNAEKDERMMSNPDLYFNCATVNKYLENYERALSGFEAAALKDPSLNATEEVQMLVNLLDKIENLLRGHAKAKRVASSASSLAAVKLSSSHKRATVDLLLEGLNKAVAVVGKVLFFVKHENATPSYYLVCDSNQTCFVLSVYGIHNDAIKEGDQLMLLEPYYHLVNFSWKGKCYQFKSIRVDFLEQVLVNGKALPPQQLLRSSIYAQHKP